MRLNLFFWFGLAAFALVVTGLFIASNPFLLAAGVAGLTWLVLSLPVSALLDGG